MLLYLLPDNAWTVSPGGPCLCEREAGDEADCGCNEAGPQSAAVGACESPVDQPHDRERSEAEDAVERIQGASFRCEPNSAAKRGRQDCDEYDSNETARASRREPRCRGVAHSDLRGWGVERLSDAHGQKPNAAGTQLDADPA